MIAALLVRHAVPVVLIGLLLMTVAGAWSFRMQRDAARVEAATALRTAAANAEALAHATAEHERQVAVLTSEAERARAQATRFTRLISAFPFSATPTSAATPRIRCCGSSRTRRSHGTSRGTRRSASSAPPTRD